MFRPFAVLLLLAGCAGSAPRPIGEADHPAPATPATVAASPVARTSAPARAMTHRLKVRSEASTAGAVHRFIASRYGDRRADALAPIVVAKARKYNLPPLLVAKVIHRESSFRTHVELRGCYGLMQVAHFHFKRGENPYDAATNVEAGCRLLAGFYKRFGNWPRALTAYNFGPNATVSRGLGTSRYARLVLSGR